MCDWGVPDWKDEENYGEYSNWDFEHWRWEFKRRTREVRKAYQLIALEEFRERFPAAIIPDNLIWQPNYKSLVYRLSSGLAASTGYPALPNPLYSNLPEDFHYYKKQDFELRTLRGWAFEACNRDEAKWTDLLGVGGIAIVFDPNKPLAPQLDGLSDYLKSIRHHSIPDDLERIHFEKWIRYIRLLDARASGASWSECADLTLPQTMHKTAQSARDSHRQATQLQMRL